MNIPENEQDIIESYFWDGFQYSTIAQFLFTYHGISISVRKLKRKLRDYGLSRRLHPSSLVAVWHAMQTELRGPGRCCGYRSMCRLLQTRHRLNVSKETVRLMLLQADPVSVSLRQQHRLRRRTYSCRGPNDVWHIDGYDKLRPYGLLVTGCIDGYSRKILWLKCGFTNHDPQVIAGHFMACTNRKQNRRQSV